MSATLCFWNPGTNSFVEVENEMNISNSNARDICEAIGMDRDFDNAPPIDIQDFQTGCENFLNGNLQHFVDRGFDTVQNGNWMDCGRRPGYLREKIELALIQCLHARLNGAKTVYFS